MRITSTLISITGLSLGLLLNSCKKEDTTPPVITINGGNVNLVIGDSYTDAGATANDDRDGDLSSLMEVDNPVNTALAGTYIVHYSVFDNTGNEGTADRYVYVRNRSSALRGSYLVKDSVWGSGTTTSYYDSITTSNTVNDRLFTTRFADQAFGAIYMDVINSGTGITVPSQNVNCGSPLQLHTFITPANGTAGGSPTVIVIDYQMTVNSVTTTARATYTHQ
ncbi:MAG TPA: immunoglobulin-like domain-containing protein [Bacteroidia bacterium]|jgi:hypothetical protein